MLQDQPSWPADAPTLDSSNDGSCQPHGEQHIASKEAEELAYCTINDQVSTSGFLASIQGFPECPQSRKEWATPSESLGHASSTLP